MLAKIGLTNVPFDNSYTDTRYLETVAEKEAYFGIANLLANAPTINFKFGNGLNTTIVYRSDTPLDETINYNYLIAQDTKTKKYYFFFITNTNFDVENQYEFSLEIDVFQTYFNKNGFTDCLIERAHLDRFINLGGGKFKLNNTESSHLYIEEDFKPTLRTVAQAEIRPLPIDDEELPVEHEWINRNVAGWELTLCYPEYYNIKVDAASSVPLVFPVRCGELKYPYTVLIKPVYYDNTRGRINVKLQSTGEIYEFSDYVEANVITPAKVYTKIYVRNMPFLLRDYCLYAGSDIGVNMTLIVDTNFRNGKYILSKQYPYAGRIVVWNLTQYRPVSYYSFPSPQQFVPEPTRDYIIKNSNNYDINPKIYLNNMYELNLTDGFTTKKYNAFGIATLPQIKMISGFAEDINRSILYLNTDDYNNIYTRYSSTLLNGLCSSNSTGLTYSQSQKDIFLGNNKNFYMQQVANQATMISQSVFNSEMAQNPIPLLNQVIGSVNNAVQAGFKMDNLDSAPENIVNGKLGIATNFLATYFGYYIQIRQPIHSDIVRLNQYTHKFGFKYNMIDNISAHINTRVAFNYIKANLDLITINVSNYVKNKFKDIFKNGIRLWHNDQVGNYVLENYERSVL